MATVSIGVACLTPGMSQSSQQLVLEADAALYLAKAKGRNCSRLASLCPTRLSIAA